MSLNRALFASTTAEHGTPTVLFDALDHKYEFTLDPATDFGYHSSQVVLERGGVICTLHGTWRGHPQLMAEYPTGAQRIGFDTGLDYDWTGQRVYLNPPYGRGVGAWMKKAATTPNCLTVALLPARTDTKWFQTYVKPLMGKPGAVEFLPGRLTFAGSENPAPFPSMVVVFDNRSDTQKPKPLTRRDNWTLSKEPIFDRT